MAADNLERLNALQTELEAAVARIAEQQVRLKEYEGALESTREECIALQSEVSQRSVEAEDAQETARRLWAAMPAEGKVAYFESDEWLPAWIKQS